MLADPKVQDEKGSHTIIDTLKRVTGKVKTCRGLCSGNADPGDFGQEEEWRTDHVRKELLIIF